MKTNLRRRSLLLLAMASSFIPSAQAFVPSTFYGALTPGESHVAMTKTALRLAYDDLGVTKITDSMKSARNTITDANARIDKTQSKNSAYHCDGENLTNCNSVINVALSKVISQLKADNVEDARKELGGALHTLQDFYSHSNWIELGHTSPHPEIGKPGPISNVAPPGTNTCIDAPTLSVCFKDNLTTSFLTSGYFAGQGRDKPIGKCRHGGGFDGSPGRGGISKDMSSCLLTGDGLFDSPHHDSHPAATALAARASFEVLKDIRSKVTDRQYKNLLGIGPTLAFAIDTTGSMGSAIAGVRAASIRIVDTRLGTDQEPSKYVLTPFNDPSVGPTTVTDDANAFKAALGGLFADGGDDCPELAMSGAFLALSASDDGGELYLFTDASAKDAGLAGSVLSLATKKKSKLFFSLFGSCSPYDPAYFFLANNTGGQAFIVSQSEAGQVAEFADLVSRSDSVDILSIGDVLTPGLKTYTFPIDSQVSRLTISVAVTDSASVSVSRTDGSVLSDSDAGVRRIPLSSALVYSIEAPQVGLWQVSAEGSGDFSILVNGQSTLSLDEFRFVENGGRPGHEGAFPITGLPPVGKKIGVLAELSGEASGVVFEFRRKNGEVLSNFTLSKNDPFQTTVQTGEVIVPNSSFVVYALGVDSSGTPFQRLLSNTFIPQELSVVAPTAVDLPVGQVTTYFFKVQNDGPTDTFRFTVFDDKSFLNIVSPATISIAAGSSTLVRVDLLPPVGTAVGTVDTLTFTAESTTRPEVRNFAVLSSQVIVPPLSGDVNRDGRVDCDDLALVKASFGTRAGAPAFNPTVDLDTNGIVDVRDLALVARKVPAGTVCK